MTVSVGISPGYNSMSNGEYEKSRRSRALGESHVVAAGMCKVMNFIN